MFGRVLIVGGSEGMIGAPSFAALAALRMGCGLAYLAVPGELLAFALTVAPEAVGMAAGSPQFVEMLQRVDAVAVGPGLGHGNGASTYLDAAMETPAPLLIDADGLNLIASGKVRLNRPAKTTVLTPHPGEMARLGRLIGIEKVPDDDAGRLEVATRAAQHFGQIVVLKGHRTVITDGAQYAVNQTGDSTLAKAGSGDILSGMICTLLGQKMPPFDAAWLGAHLHGKAGERVGRHIGQRSGLARDVVEAIPAVTREYPA
jgi:NAD(P)H-hydrate epimerase